MSKQNFETFRGLLRGAICFRPQAQFAREAGISPEHLNRMLNADVIHRPSKVTLHKIAAVAKNGITYQLLKDALDKDDPNPSEPDSSPTAPPLSFPDAAQMAMAALSNVIKAQPYPIIANSLAEHMDALMSAVAHKSPILPKISYDLGVVRPYPGQKDCFATNYVCVDLSMADDYYTATSNMLLYLIELPSRSGDIKYVVRDASCAVSDIMELFGMPPAALAAHENESKDSGEGALDQAMNDPFYLDIQKAERFKEVFNGSTGESPERRLLNAIFGENQTRIPVVTDGTGFALKETPPNLAGFFLSHRDALLSPYLSEPENYNKIVNAMDSLDKTKELQPFLDELDEINYSDDNIENDFGWPAAIAVIMSEETGFPFLYKKKSEDPSGKFPWLSKDSVIILSNNAAERDGIQREAILMVTCRYVRELGLKRFGDIIFANIQSIFSKRRSYVINNVSTDNDETEDIGKRKDEDYSVRFEDNPYPEKEGLYAVKLKDGRRMSLVFLSKLHVWIRNHKEWSDLIDSYCPEPLPLPHSCN